MQLFTVYYYLWIACTKQRAMRVTTVYAENKAAAATEVSYTLPEPPHEFSHWSFYVIADKPNVRRELKLPHFEDFNSVLGYEELERAKL